MHGCTSYKWRGGLIRVAKAKRHGLGNLNDEVEIEGCRPRKSSYSLAAKTMAMAEMATSDVCADDGHRRDARRTATTISTGHRGATTISAAMGRDRHWAVGHDTFDASKMPNPSTPEHPGRAGLDQAHLDHACVFDDGTGVSLITDSWHHSIKTRLLVGACRTPRTP